MARRSLPPSLQLWAVGVTALLVFATTFAVFGFVGWANPPTPVVNMNMPTFLRPMRPNCGDVFYCINATDPNPSYLAYWTPTDGPVPAPWLPSFEYDAAVFDVSNPFATTVLIDGTYQFVVFTPMISFTSSFDVAIVLTRDPGLLLSTPALSGDLGPSGLSNITVIPTRAATTTAIAKLTAGTSVRVGYVVNVDGPAVTPGAYFGGTLLARG